MTYGKKTISYKAGTYWNNLTSEFLKYRLFQHLIDIEIVFSFASPLKCGMKASIIFCSVSITSVFKNFLQHLMYFSCIIHVFPLTIALIGLAVLFDALLYRFVNHSCYCGSFFISLVPVDICECRE